MRGRCSALAATVALAAVAALAVPQAWGTVVTLRVESATAPAPLFAGPVETLPHAVDGGDGSGAHPCWGPGGAPPTASATGALDDALRGAGISWRGNWNPSFRDFFVDRIGQYASASPDRYWSLTVNGRFSAGGCLTQVDEGDSVRFYYGPLFGAPHDIEGTDAVNGPSIEDGPGPAAVGRSTRRPRQVAMAANRYLRRSEGPGEEWARLALALRDSRGAARAAAALLGDRLSSQRGDGSIEGDVNATALAVLALQRHRPLRANRGAVWLAAHQSADGGFGYRPGVPPDVDTTGLATWALAVAGRQAAASRGGEFVRGAQALDGGFPPIPGDDSNSQSTGLGVVALRVAGIGPRQAIAPSGLTPIDYLASRARRDGSIAYGERSSPTPVWSTAQALLGLTARSKLLSVGGASTRED